MLGRGYVRRVNKIQQNPSPGGIQIRRRFMHYLFDIVFSARRNRRRTSEAIKGWEETPSRSRVEQLFSSGLRVRRDTPKVSDTHTLIVRARTLSPVNLSSIPPSLPSSLVDIAGRGPRILILSVAHSFEIFLPLSADNSKSLELCANRSPPVFNKFASNRGK